MPTDLISQLQPPYRNRLLFSLKEVSEIANICRSGLYEEIANGSIKKVLYGGKARIERAELVRWLQCKPFEVPMPKDYDPDAALTEAVNHVAATRETEGVTG